MQYYVIGPDGNKYGPADVATLKSWITENRLTPDSMVEDFNTGQRMKASAVPGLFEGQTTTATAGPTMGPATGTMYQNPPTPGTVYNPGMVAGDNGQNDLTWAWIFGAASLLCCGPLCIAGIMRANSAAAKGNPGANAAKIFNIVAAVIWCLFFVLRMVGMVTMFGSSAGRGFGQ